jgi:hypothetical protein
LVYLGQMKLVQILANKLNPRLNGGDAVVILNMYVSAGVIIAIVAFFLFTCGFIAGYAFGNLAALKDKNAAVAAEKRKRIPASQG